MTVSAVEAASETGRLPRRVIKLGGSLLQRPGLLADVECWLTRCSPAINLVVIGGGELIDAVRKLDGLRPGDPIATHWRCVELMQVTFEIVRDWFPTWGTIESAEDLKSGCAHDFSAHDLELPRLVAVGSFYRRGMPSELPESWHTTSDTIAAQLAIEIRAQRLVLLKACEVDPVASVGELARRGIVDEVLPAFASRIPELQVMKLGSGLGPDQQKR